MPRGSGSPSGVAAIEADDSGRLWFSKLYDYSIWQWDGRQISRIGAGEAPDWFTSSYPSEYRVISPEEVAVVEPVTRRE